ncbi:MAG: glycosyltransferase [Magnetospirillum sp.]|nr:glycosyltransferase [Magnetospirillum sp.]
MRIFLGSPGLMSFTGHDFGYLDCLRTALRQAGHAVNMLGCQRMAPELASREGVLPTFSVATFALQRPAHQEEILERKAYYTMVTEALRAVPETEALGNVRKSALRRYDWHAAWVVDSTLQDIDRLDSSFSLSASDLFIVDAVKSEHMAGLAEWAAYRLRTAGPNAVPGFALVLHFDILQGDDGPAVENAYRNVFALIRASGLADRFAIFADTDALTRRFSALGAMDVVTLPIPHTRHAEAPASRHDGGAPIVAFVGAGYGEHGFHLLPYVADRFSGLVAEGRLRFEIQANLGGAPDEMMSMAYLALGRMPVTLHRGVLSAADYYGILARADICLLPYPGEQFRNQSSGVFAEAVAFGTVPIVPAGTWMADIVERHGIGVVFPPSAVEDIHAAIERALAGLDTLKRRSAAFAENWRRINAPENYLDVMGRRIGGRSLLDPAFTI